MKTPPTELEFHRSTEGEHDRAAIHGGWVECWIDCPVCGKSEPHRHYICKTCGMTDFVNHEYCAESWDLGNTIRIGRAVRQFVTDHGHSLVRLGFCLAVLVVFTLSNWSST